MKRLNLAAAAVNQTPLDWDGNRDRIIAAIEIARGRGATMVCLPELCVSGYGCEDMFHAPAVWEMSAQVVREIAPATTGLIASAGLPVFHEGALYNAACVMADGAIRGFAVKRHLAGDGIYYEPRWFRPWRGGQTDEVEFGGEGYPIGSVLFSFNGVRLGFEICEDAWAPDRPGAELARRGVDVLFNPSASHFSFGKVAVREAFVLDGSRAFGAAYVYANMLGNEAGRLIYDGHTMIAADGRLLAQGRRFAFDPVQVAVASVDLDALRAARARRSGFDPHVEPGAGDVSVPITVTSATAPDDVDDPLPQPWARSAEVKCEEFTRAVTLALHDYLRKSRSRGFVVSLSGGADSSAVASLIATMVDRGCRELGAAEYARRVGVDTGGDGSAVRRIVGVLLTTLYQSTRNSSDTTRAAARELAEGIGARHVELDVDDLYGSYVQRIEDALGVQLTWKDHDLALQNIQARVRAPGAWLIANLEGRLLVSTSNRSEAAVGYATMDGDTSGGLSPIAGIDKAFLLHWLRWMETSGPDDGAPIAALRVVNDLEPTAELRPLEQFQTDEADLMPYPILEAIEEAAIGRKLSPLDVYRDLHPRLHDVEPAQLRQWIHRFFVLWSRNQWKRERYAPAFHVDDRNLDPKTWCRFPILSGGFARELEQLERDQCR